MEREWYLFIANAVIWTGVGGYLFFLARTQAALALRLKRMEMSRDHGK